MLLLEIFSLPVLLSGGSAHESSRSSYAKDDDPSLPGCGRIGRPEQSALALVGHQTNLTYSSRNTRDAIFI